MSGSSSHSTDALSKGSQDGRDVDLHDRPPPKFDPYWNFQVVIFQVEDTLFSVLKNGFMVKGTMFEPMLGLPTEDPKTALGSSPDNPINLEDTSAKDFRTFLEVLYPPDHEIVPLYPSRWVAVLRLASKWGFVKIRQKAITALTPPINAMSGQIKIGMGKEFHVRDWLKDGLVELALQKNSTIQELQGSLDQDTIMKLFFIQSAAWQKQEESTRNRGSFQFTSYVRDCVEEVFAPELAKADYTPDKS